MIQCVLLLFTILQKSSQNPLFVQLTGNKHTLSSLLCWNKAVRQWDLASCFEWSISFQYFSQSQRSLEFISVDGYGEERKMCCKIDHLQFSIITAKRPDWSELSQLWNILSWICYIFFHTLYSHSFAHSFAFLLRTKIHCN